jgi:hypothetical protein
MKKRISIIYKDGEKSNGYLEDIDGELKIRIGGAIYDLHSFAATGATIPTNDQATLDLLIANGINARPTGKQTTITISVTESMKERLVDAGSKYRRTTTSILVEAAEAWLDSHDC